MKNLVMQRKKKVEEEKKEIKPKNTTSEEMARDIILQKHWNGKK